MSKWRRAIFYFPYSLIPIRPLHAKVAKLNPVPVPAGVR